LALGCSAGGLEDGFDDELAGSDDASIGSVQEAACQDHWQNVETYEDLEGVPADFVADHERSVGIMRSDTGRCSGTLIGDGLFFTAAHCFTSAAIGRVVDFNYQYDPDGVDRPTERYRIAQILEENPGPTVTDHALVRLFHAPERHWGYANIDMRPPDLDEPLVVIGHPRGGRKVVDVGGVASLSPAEDPTNIVYRSLDIVDGASGSSVLSANTGRIIGMTRSGPSTCGNGSGNGNTMTRVRGVSEFMQEDHASGRLYSFTDSGLNVYRWAKKNWRSSWDDIVAGHFVERTTQELIHGVRKDQLFFYDRAAGEAQFYTANKGSFDRLGPAHTGLNTSSRTWTHVVPVQMDDTDVDELLFYDSIHGYGRFYSTDGAGSLNTAGPLLGWSTGWRHIVTGNFSSRAGDEILFYDGNSGQLVMYGTNGSGTNRGKITRLGEVGYFGTDIGQIVVGQFSAASPTEEVMLYDPVSDYVTFLRFDSAPAAVEFGRREAFGTFFTQIVTGDFSSASGTELLFYEPSPDDYYDETAVDSGTFYYYTVSEGELTLRLEEPGHRRSMSKLVAGAYWTNSIVSGDIAYPRAETSLVMYDRYRE
jgi:hypothetical protein